MKTSTTSPIFEESDVLAEELKAAIAVPLYDDTQRIRTSGIACSLSLEHWESARILLRFGMLPSAVGVHRSQFEALLRSIWLLYAASDSQLCRLNATLSIETEQAAKNMRQTSEMMQDLEKKAPPQAYDALSRFKENSWKALNSYVHAGVHPIRRHEDGYPTQLVHDVLRNANGLAIVSCMQAVVLSGRPTMQRSVLDLAAKHPLCMPPLL